MRFDSPDAESEWETQIIARYDRYKGIVPDYFPVEEWVNRFNESLADLTEGLGWWLIECSKLTRVLVRENAKLHPGTQLVAGFAVKEEVYVRTRERPWPEFEEREQWYFVQNWFADLGRIICLWSDIHRVGIDTSSLLTFATLMDLWADWECRHFLCRARDVNELPSHESFVALRFQAAGRDSAAGERDLRGMAKTLRRCSLRS